MRSTAATESFVVRQSWRSGRLRRPEGRLLAHYKEDRTDPLAADPGTRSAPDRGRNPIATVVRPWGADEGEALLAPAGGGIARAPFMPPPAGAGRGRRSVLHGLTPVATGFRPLRGLGAITVHSSHSDAAAECWSEAFRPCQTKAEAFTPTPPAAASRGLGAQGQSALCHLACRRNLLGPAQEQTRCANWRGGDHIILPFFALLFLSFAPARAETPPPNLIYNGSFELGLLKDWWGIQFPNARFLPENVTEEDAVHGKRCLTLSGTTRFFSRYISFQQPGEYRFHFHVKASVPGTVAISFRAPPPPSPDNTASERTLALKRFPVSREWVRHEFSAHLPEGEFALLISASSESGGPTFWFDAFELSASSVADASVSLGKGDEDEDEDEDEAELFEEEEKTTSVSSAFPVEAGLVSDIPGHIFYRGEPSDVDLVSYNYGAKTASAAIQYELRDIEDQVVKTGRSAAAEVPAGQLVTRSFTLPTDTDGLFSLQYHLVGEKRSLCEIVYTVIEKPTGPTILGAHTYADRYHLPVLRRAGVQWYVSLTDGFLRSVNVHPEKGKYVWDDQRARRLKELGFTPTGVLGHARFAEWGPRVSVKLESPILQRGGYFESRLYVRDDVWQDHVRTILTHYKDTFKRWIIDDEINAGWDPRSYLRILKTTRELAQEIIPDVQVTTSADVHFFEELIDIAGPDSFDAICGSIGNASIWEKRKTRFLSEKYDKPVWVNALFGYSRSAYRIHRGPGTLDRLDRAITMFRHMIRNFFISRATYVSPYILRLSKQSTRRPMPKTMLDYDGGLVPHGFGFIHGGTRLAALVEENVGVLKMDDYTPMEAYAYKGHGRAGVFLMRRGSNVSIKWVEGMECSDWLGRALTPPVEDGRLRITLARAPVTLTVPVGRADELFAAVRSLQLDAETPVSALKVFEKFGYRGDSLVLEKHLTNESAEPQTTPISPEKSITLDPGESKVVPFPIPWNRDRPLDNYLTPGRRRLWLHNCMERSGPITINGDLSDWGDRSASWLLMTWDVLAFYSRRYQQVLDGGEHMSYNPREDCKVGFRSEWDNSSVYFAVKVYDDSVPDGGKKADRVVVRFGDDPVLEVSVGPHFRPVSTPPGRQVESAATRTADGYELEVRIALPANEPRLNRFIPFDFHIHDVDEDVGYQGDEKYRWSKTILRWAGWSPNGGQMIFVDRYVPPKMPEVGD